MNNHFMVNVTSFSCHKCDSEWHYHINITLSQKYANCIDESLIKKIVANQNIVVQLWEIDQCFYGVVFMCVQYIDCVFASKHKNTAFNTEKHLVNAALLTYSCFLLSTSLASVYFLSEISLHLHLHIVSACTECRAANCCRTSENVRRNLGYCPTRINIDLTCSVHIFEYIFEALECEFIA